MARTALAFMGKFSIRLTQQTCIWMTCAVCGCKMRKPLKISYMREHLYKNLSLTSSLTRSCQIRRSHVFWTWTSAPIGALEVKSTALLGSYDRPTNNGPTHQPTVSLPMWIVSIEWKNVVIGFTWGNFEYNCYKCIISRFVFHQCEMSDISYQGQSCVF